MRTRVFSTGLEACKRAADVVVSGGVILYPTSTVYGLGGDSKDPTIVERIGVIKGRAPTNPMLVLTDEWSRVEEWFLSVRPWVQKLMAHPSSSTLTFLLPASPAAPEHLVGIEGLIGIRRTSNEFCRTAIELADTPLISTSANKSGTPTSSSFSGLNSSIVAEVDAAFDAGRPLVGSPSTIVRCDGPEAVVLREGEISREDLLKIIG